MLGEGMYISEKELSKKLKVSKYTHHDCRNETLDTRVPRLNLQLCSCHFEPCYRMPIYAKLLQGTVLYVCLPYYAWYSKILLKLEKEGSDCTNNPMVQT